MLRRTPVDGDDDIRPHIAYHVNGQVVGHTAVNQQTAVDNRRRIRKSLILELSSSAYDPVVHWVSESLVAGRGRLGRHETIS